MAMSQKAQASLSLWWQGPEFPRYVMDLLVDAIARLRPGGLTIAKGAAADLRLDSLDLDS